MTVDDAISLIADMIDDLNKERFNGQVTFEVSFRGGGIRGNIKAMTSALLGPPKETECDIAAN